MDSGQTSDLSELFSLKLAAAGNKVDESGETDPKQKKVAGLKTQSG